MKEASLRSRLLAIGFVLISTALYPAVCHAPARAQSEPAVDAKIEIVWPHDAQGNYASVSTARFVNVEVYLFERGTLNPVPCDFSNPVVLRWAQNIRDIPGTTRVPYGVLNPAGQPIGPWPATIGTGQAVGQRTTRTINGETLPIWVFNDVPVLPAQIPAATLPAAVTTYFLAEVPGADYRTNVWAHGDDPRAFVPVPRYPLQLTSSPPATVEALVQVVWPHDAAGHQQPVTRASLANVAVDLFQQVHLQVGCCDVAVGRGFDHQVWLLRALDNGFLERVKPADRVVTMVGGVATGVIEWPRWLFDDVDVAAAQDPRHRYYFAAEVDGVPTDTTIWAHGADARTFFPQRDIPVSSGAACS